MRTQPLEAPDPTRDGAPFHAATKDCVPKCWAAQRLALRGARPAGWVDSEFYVQSERESKLETYDCHLFVGPDLARGTGPAMRR